MPNQQPSELENAIGSGTADEIAAVIPDAVMFSERWFLTIAKAIVAERESRVPSPETIDRVCEGLAELAVQDEAIRRLYLGPTRYSPLPISPKPYHLLLDLLGIAERKEMVSAANVLASHFSTPDELVAALRGLAKKNKGEPNVAT